MYNLNKLVPPGSKVLSMPLNINDRGEIATWEVDDVYNARAVLLIPRTKQ
jgi:hypothetical protein